MGIVLQALKREKPKSSPRNVPSSAATVAYIDKGRIGKTNVSMYRNWAEHSEWVRAAIGIRKSQVSAADWDVVPYVAGEPFDEGLQQELHDLFDMPNAKNDSFRSFVEPIVEDILTLDAGCVEKVQNLLSQPVELWPVDGGQVRIDALWDGDPAAYRYYWYPDNTFPRASWTNDQLVYIMANPATYRVTGLSPLETLKLVIDAELNANDYNRRQVTNAAPDGLLDLGEGARPDQVDRFRSQWEAELTVGGPMAIIGGTKGAKFQAFRASNRDMQFLEWQVYLVRKIASVFGLSPQDLGLTFDVNRASSEQQAQNTEDRGLRPLMSLIQDYFTREIVWDKGFGGRLNNLAFRFTSLNLKENYSKAQINELALGKVPWKTINEARKDDGREPMDGDIYDKLLVVTPQGLVSVDDVPTASEAMGISGPLAQKPAASQENS